METAVISLSKGEGITIAFRQNGRYVQTFLHQLDDGEVGIGINCSDVPYQDDCILAIKNGLIKLGRHTDKMILPEETTVVF